MPLSVWVLRPSEPYTSLSDDDDDIMSDDEYVTSLPLAAKLRRDGAPIVLATNEVRNVSESTISGRSNLNLRGGCKPEILADEHLSPFAG